MSEYDNNIKVDSLDSTLVTEGYKPNRDSALRLNRSLQSLSSPYSEPVRLKFPKKLCRKQTSMTMLIETGEEQPRPSLRVFNEFKQSTVFEGNPENNSYKRMRSPGVFHSLSLESKTPPPQSVMFLLFSDPQRISEWAKIGGGLAYSDRFAMILF